MRIILTINSILYFTMYSISLSTAWFEYGINYPNVEGIEAIWFFPVVYLLMFIISLRYVFVDAENNSSYLTMGITTISFISICWGVSLLFMIGQKNFDSSTIIYPAVLFGISLIVFTLYLYIYLKNKKST